MGDFLSAIEEFSQAAGQPEGARHIPRSWDRLGPLTSSLSPRVHELTPNVELRLVAAQNVRVANHMPTAIAVRVGAKHSVRNAVECIIRQIWEAPSAT